MVVTDENGEKVYISLDQVETIAPRKFRGGTVIYLVSGRSVECIEDFRKVVEKFEINKALSK